MSSQQRAIHTMHILGNVLVLAAIVVVLAGTAFNYSQGIELQESYALILRNPILVGALGALIYGGALLPIWDPEKDRRAKLRSLSNRSFAAMFVVNIILIPALGALPSINMFIVLNGILMATAVVAATMQLTSAVKRSALTAILEMLGAVLVVFAAVIQVFVTRNLMLQLQYPWITSLTAVTAGVILLLLSRRMQVKT